MIRNNIRVRLFLAATVVLAGCRNESLMAAVPKIVIDPLALDYGPVPTGLEVSLSFHVRNTGKPALLISAIEVAAPFRVVAAPTEVGAGELVTVEVAYKPTTEGEHTATLHVKSNADREPDAKVVLSGRGTPRLICTACNMPPANYCSGRVLITYAPFGSCVTGKCQYQADSTTCGGACNAQLAICTNALPMDAGTDAGVMDAGVMDAGVMDASVMDASVMDAGVMDAGGASDAGLAVFATAGETTFVVPPGVTSVTVKAWGGGGAAGNQLGATGGGAAFARATLAVTPGESLNVWVAEGGKDPGNGAGASFVLRATTPLVVAAGGGGGGSDGCSGCASGGRGGAGGGLLGEAGANLSSMISPYCTSATGGQGGSASAGGMGGTNSGSAANRCNGQPGSSNTGGRASGVNGTCDLSAGASRWQQGGGQINGGGGGGGAGYFGGGGAGFIWTYCAGGGGGGSSYAVSGATQVLLVAGAAIVEGNSSESLGSGHGGAGAAVKGADGRVVLTY